VESSEAPLGYVPNNGYKCASSGVCMSNIWQNLKVAVCFLVFATDYYRKNYYTFRLYDMNNMCRIGRGSFWFCWFAVNRSTFHEDVREKRFLHFRSHFSVTFISK